MQEPLRIAFRNMTAPIGVEDDIRRHIAELEQFFDRIIACHVVVEVDHRRHRQGNPYRIQIVLTVPGHDVIVRREPPHHQQHEDLHLAVGDAFHAAQRQLQDYVRKMQGVVKTHEPRAIGTIGQVLPDHAFLNIDTGEAAYPHRTAALGPGFAKPDSGGKACNAKPDSDPDAGPHAATVITI